jgi:hypothetical protein
LKPIKLYVVVIFLALALEIHKTLVVLIRETLVVLVRETLVVLIRETLANIDLVLEVNLRDETPNDIVLEVGPNIIDLILAPPQ